MSRREQMQNRYFRFRSQVFSLRLRFSSQPLSRLSHIKWRIADLQNREGDRSRGGGDFQRSDSSPGSRPSSVLPDLLTSSPGQRQDKSTSEEVRFIYMYSMFFFFVLYIDPLPAMRALVYIRSFHIAQMRAYP